MAAARIFLFLAVALLASLIVPVACSQSEDSGWVGTTPLEKALTNGKPTLAEFGANSCVPCRQMKPILKELVAEHGDKLNLAFIDVYQRRDLHRICAEGAGI